MDVPTIAMDELLDLGPAGQAQERARSGAGRESGRSAPRVDAARCPAHADPRPVTLTRSGGHLSWRAHDVITWGGARRSCQASGVHLCTAPALPTPGVPTPVCDCQLEDR